MSAQDLGDGAIGDAALRRGQRHPAPFRAAPALPSISGAAPHPAVEWLRRLPALHWLFQGLEPELARQVEDTLDWFGVPAGTVLFREGDEATEAFVLTFGRLGVFMGSENGRKLIAKINVGEVAGEMAMITEERRSATVVALQDSDLVRVSRRTMDQLLHCNPETAQYVLRLLARRLHQTSRLVVSKATDSSDLIAFVTLGDGKPFGEAVRRLTHQPDAITISTLEQENQWRDSAAGEAGGDERLVAYTAQSDNVAWARHCIRQAERVIFVADADGGVIGTEAIAFATNLHREIDLVLVHKANAATATGGTAWLPHFRSEHILHVRSGNAADYERVRRLVSRAGICMVFSGGGARGFAHLGVIRAFAEKGIPIDAVGGTSMGALVAGGLALGLSPDAVETYIRNAFVGNNPIRDYTLPVIALTRGHKSNRLLREGYGETLIENLWKTFFCLSTDLATGQAMVHQSGLLWRALSASSALPGIFPPVLENHRVLVDGGLIDNFPTSTMRSLHRGLVVGVEVCSDYKLSPEQVTTGKRSSLWHLFGRRRHVPPILRILMRSGTVNSEAQLAASRAAADLLVQPRLSGVDMLSFTAFDKTVETGYRVALETISQFDLRDPARLIPLNAA